MFIRGKSILNLRNGCHELVPVDNKIDKDVQSMLQPLNLMNNILLFPKYRIKNNFINSNSFISYTVTLCYIIISSAVFIYRIYVIHSNEFVRKFMNTIYLCSYFDFFAFSVGAIMNLIINVLQTKIFILFVLKIQDIHRVLNDTKFKHFSIRNWISVIYMLCSHICLLIFCHIQLNVPSYEFCCGVATMIFDVNVMYAIRLIELLRIKMDLWNIQAKRLKQMDENDCKIMFKAYANILECYDMYRVGSLQMVSWFRFYFITS